MDQTLLAVVIGGVIGALPSVVNALLTSHQQSASRKHELRKMKLDLFQREKMEALKRYSIAYGHICSNVYNVEYLAEFKAASSILDMMVTEQTHHILEKTSNDIFSEAEERYFDRESHIRTHSSHPNVDAELRSALRCEMDALQHAKVDDTFEILPPPVTPAPDPIKDQVAKKSDGLNADVANRKTQ